MEPFLDRLLAAFRAEPLGKDRQITTTVDPSARVLVLDPNRIRQALLALLRSVAQATPPQLPIELDVRALEQGNACFEVLSPPAGHVRRRRPRTRRRPPAPRARPPRRSPRSSWAWRSAGWWPTPTAAVWWSGPRPEKRETAVQLWIADADPEETLA